MGHRVAHSLLDLPEARYVVTIGSFDGLHRGHQHLLSHVVQRATSDAVRSLAVTFDPLPAEVLRPDKSPPRLSSLSDRIEQMIAQGIDHVAVLRFDEAMANQTAEKFLKDLVTVATPPAIVVGADFAFGHKRQGTPQFLAEKADDFGFELVVVDRINPESGVEWSSSFARRALTEGDVRLARNVLGRPFRLSGVVQNGDHRGRDLGYPTANLNLPENLVVPADGIYAAFVTLEEDKCERYRPALVYIGTRPTFGSSSRVIEVYLLDFDADLYGQEVTIDFVERLRGDRGFDSPDELVRQMEMDEEHGRKVLADPGISHSCRDK
jgi:riboflavin kinase / FMN adenylyltransferase